MSFRSALRALPLLLLAACALVPDDETAKPESKTGPQFDADYYAVNAKEYMTGAQYARAKAQWATYLELRPGDWMAQVGAAYCDLFLAEETVVERGDIEAARKLLADARKRFTEVRTGPIEADTLDPTTTPMWKAAMGSAMAARYAGALDALEARRDAEASLSGAKDAAEKRDASDRFAKSRDANYAEAITLFERLAAMKNASPEAVRNLGQLYLVTRQDARAEKEFERYLDFARTTRAGLEQGKAQVGEGYQADRAAVVETLYDRKLSSNAAKQIAVLDDLAGLSFSKGDFRKSKARLEEALTLDSERADLYLKLAQSEGELQMYETAIMRVDEFLKRASRRREDFDERIFRAMKLKEELERKLKK